MKFRNGFVSNSSSSSFLIISPTEINTREDWKNTIFKDTRSLKKSIEKSIDAILKIKTDKEYRKEEIPFNEALSFYEVKNWKELLLDKESWLYQDILNQIHTEIRFELHNLPGSSFGGDLAEDIQFGFLYDMNWYRSTSDSYDVFITECVDNYIERILKELECSDKLYFYRLDTCSDCGVDSVNFEESYFLRLNFSKIVQNSVEYMRFEYS